MDRLQPQTKIIDNPFFKDTALLMLLKEQMIVYPDGKREFVRIYNTNAQTKINGDSLSEKVAKLEVIQELLIQVFTETNFQFNKKPVLVLPSSFQVKGEDIVAITNIPQEARVLAIDSVLDEYEGEDGETGPIYEIEKIGEKLVEYAAEYGEIMNFIGYDSLAAAFSDSSFMISPDNQLLLVNW